jgi:predicted neuraminidase
MLFFNSQPIFLPGKQPFQQCHASTLVETTDGRLLTAWFGGTYEGHPDVAIWLSEGLDGRWGNPVKIAEVLGVPLWNPVLFRDAADRIWLFYKVGPTVEEKDILDIEARLAVTTHTNISTVYNNLKDGSCNRLRAFVST